MCSTVQSTPLEDVCLSWAVGLDTWCNERNPCSESKAGRPDRGHPDCGETRTLTFSHPYILSSFSTSRLAQREEKQSAQLRHLAGPPALYCVLLSNYKLQNVSSPLAVPPPPSAILLILDARISVTRYCFCCTIFLFIAVPT